MVKKMFPIAIILIVWFIFSYPIFLQNKIAFPSDFLVNNVSLWGLYENFWSPVKNPAMPDVISQMYPWKKFTIEMLKGGQIPFWDPYSLSGTPHLANYQSAVFSTTNIFYFVFDFKNAWNLSVVIQPLLAGLFTYLFARSLKLSSGASLLSSVSFMFCGFITTWMNYTTLSLAISFLPLALLAIEKFSDNFKSRWLLILSIAITLSFFSGHFQTSFYLGLFTYGYILFKFLENKNIKKFIYLNIFYLSGILLASPQLIPTMEFYLNSSRSKGFGKVSPFPLTHLPTIISPDFYGNPVTRNNFSLIYAEYSLFAGVIPFCLSILTLLSKNKSTLFFLISAIVALILSIDTPLTNLLISAQIPVISTSALSRILVIFSFSIAILGGYGLDLFAKHLMERNYKKISLWVISLIGMFLVIWIFVLSKKIDPLYYPIALKNLILPSGLFLAIIFSIFIGIKKSIIRFSIALLIILTIFDMLRFATKWQPYTSKDLAFPATPIINKLITLDNTYRTHAPFTAEGSVYFKIPITEGYTPLYIDKYGDFIASIIDGKIKSSSRYTVSLPLNPNNLDKAINLLNIKYVLVKKSDLSQSWVFPIGKFPEDRFKKIYEDDKFLIFENNQVFPKAYLVGDYTVQKSEQEILNKIIDKNFDLEKHVIIEKDPKINKSKLSTGETKITEYSPNKITVITNSEKNSFLVLGENFYPGWEVKVNGEKKEILRSNYTFKSVLVPSGKSTVEFYYFPKSFKDGLKIAIFALATMLASLIVKLYLDKRGNKPESVNNKMLKKQILRLKSQKNKKY